MPVKRKPSGRVTAKKPMRHEVQLCMDPVAAGRLWKLQNERDDLLAKVKNGGKDVQAELDICLRDIDEWQDKVADETVTFVGLSIGKNSWKTFKADYPPTREQKREYEKDGTSLSWDPDAFPPAALRRCLRISETDEQGHEILTELDDDLINTMFDEDDSTWNEAEVEQLLMAVLMANETWKPVPPQGN